MPTSLALIGIFHFLFRKHFLLVSLHRDRAHEERLRVRWWDFFLLRRLRSRRDQLCPHCRVLLVFSYLIVPAVCGITLAGTLTKRLLIGWIVALIGSVAGLYFSFYGDFPSGAAIVCTFGALLVLVTLGGLLRPRHIPDM